MTRQVRANTPAATITQLLEHVDLVRFDATRRLDPARRYDLGQFLTPINVATFMASMFAARPKAVHLLDAGAGVGTLAAAYVASACSWPTKPVEIGVTAFEVDSLLIEYLRETLKDCQRLCEANGIAFRAHVYSEDFIATGTAALQGGLFSSELEPFTAAILNPPYKKINANSETRLQLRTIGVETTNLYAGFLLVASRLLGPSGELIAITPRSFCNGPYFRPFRQEFLSALTLKHIHVFETRTHAFEDDSILQENVITYGVKGSPRSEVLVTSSAEPRGDGATERRVPYYEMVHPDDPEAFIRIVSDETASQVAGRMGTFQYTLEDLSVSVSTGRVVDFRAKRFLRADPGLGTAPLIYPTHFDGGFVAWPKPGHKKPNALEVNDATASLFVPAGMYVLVRRFSAKEEGRRIVAAVYDSRRVPGERVGFENHLNYYHVRGAGLPINLAKGLAAFLNSSLVDAYFRQFNGHTQVNATDLRSLKYPSHDELGRLGARIGTSFPDQRELDDIVNEELFDMADPANGPDPIQTKRRIDEAISVLRQLGLPREQQNERSALALLALLGLSPETPWTDAKAPMLGITPMMTFFERQYGKKYAPNTRETVRRFTIHQFVEAHLVVQNPDEPARPTNSPKQVYQIELKALVVLRTFGTPEWEGALREYVGEVGTLKQRHAREREMELIPLNLPSGVEIRLSPGGQNVLVKQIIDEFCPRFTPGAEILYIGDTGEKMAYFDEEALAALGVTVDEHGKIPDVVVYDRVRNWLMLIEAVTSHGPMNPKRRDDLEDIFGAASAGLVYVTAFLDRNAMKVYLPEISWETEVWVADAPSHMIHFNGERFLGPYQKTIREASQQ